ncbi:MAG: reprolysin-like metallopeptidase, partial [Bacteroidota bacterium]
MHHIATLCLTLLFCFVYSTTFGQQELEIWNPLPSHSLDSKQALKAMDMPASFAAHQMTNLASLTSLLQAAPIRFSDEARHSPTAIALPMPNGQTERFKLVNFPVMEAGLAGRYPQLKTFTGISARNPHKTAKVTMTPQGLFAIILGDPAGTIFVRPFNLAEQTYYAFYAKDHPKDNEAFTCAMEDTRVEIDHHHAGQRSRDCQLRQYRLALACTGEYTQFYSDDDDSNGDIVADALASMVIMVNQLNGIFENELGTTLILVDQNTDIIFTNPNTDPYTNDSSSEMINENVPVCTNIIGDANFDIGHVFGLGGGGLAFRNSPCTGNKARGVTKVNGLPGTPSDLRTAAHEFGHQFGARHTQNNDCSRSAFASYEPGSGSTIMSYAGICFPSIQSSSDFYFHAVSIDEMSSFVTETGNSCATILNTTNQQPVANAGDDYTIPFATPFVLTANGTDPEGDTLSYAWEQWDREFAPMPPLASSTEGPSFRSFPPSADPQRYFPRLEVLLGSAPNTWEVLPEVARPLNFRLTVRDNNDAYGCTAQSDMSIAVDDTTGPFRVTYPDSDSLWSVGETQFINWDVANTNNAPINCANVDIFYSTDGGWTYPNVLATNVPNNGNYTFTVPEVTSATIRFMVKCADNIFFAISEENVSIGSQIICRQFNSSDVPIAISETGTPTIISQ